MTESQATGDLVTHEVSNQPPRRGDEDLFGDDAALSLYAGHASKALAPIGAAWGHRQFREAGAQANAHTPELVSFDAGGRRLDEVRYTDAYHKLMQLGIGAGYSALPWEDGQRQGHLTHAAMVYMMSQIEPGVCCPMTMTYAAVPALSYNPDLAAIWVPKLTSRRYDPSVRPLSAKQGATLGMAMTEKQGGSDVGTNTTRAEPDGADYRLYGHKWFCSAPMSDGFLTLAQAPGGITCFLVPRWLEDGTRNRIHLMRLKDKLGNRANASAEIEYHGAFAQRIGNEGEGIHTIIEMVHYTRLDTCVAPAGLMRGALRLAHYWCEHRTAFQERLIDQPLMRRVLGDLALDWEGATALACHVARAFDGGDAAFARVGVALAKFLNNKLAPRVTLEAMEALGGMGYVEESGAPLFYREAPLNSIWEGSGNVICLDILRSLGREEVREALGRELVAPAGTDARYDAAVRAWDERWSDPQEEDARQFAEETARLLTAGLLMRDAPDAVSDGYLATRLAPGMTTVAGAVTGLDDAALVGRLASD